MSVHPAKILNAFYAFKELHQRKRMSAQTAFVAGVHFGTAEAEAETRRMTWLERHNSAAHDQDTAEHWVVAWLGPDEPGANGVGGRHVASAASFRDCIDKFLAGEVKRAN